MIKNRLIFMIQGNYYVMDYPGIDDTRQLLKQVCEDDLWKDAKSKGGASMRAMIKIRESKEMMSIHLDEWITDPFLVYHWTRPYQKYLLKSSGITTSSRNLSKFAKGVEVLSEITVWPSKEPVQTISDKAKIGFRPMLIPMAPDTGYSLSIGLHRVHKNGEVIRCGSLYLNGEPVPKEEIGNIEFTTDSDFCIDDTYDEEHALEWVWLQGKLFPTRNLFRVSPLFVEEVIGKLQ